MPRLGNYDEVRCRRQIAR